MTTCAHIPNVRNRRNPHKLSVELRQPAIKMYPDTQALSGKALKMAGTFNRKQKVCLWAGVAVIAAMVVYLPWIARLTDQGAVHSQNRIGYAWLWARPKLSWEPYGARLTVEVTPDLARLAGELAVVTIITASLMVAFKTNQNRKIQVLIIAHVLLPFLCIPFFMDVLHAYSHRWLALGLPFVVPLIILVLFELKR
jgi:hypothetical protein